MRFLLVIVILLPIFVFSQESDTYDDQQIHEENVNIPECEENEVWMECSSCEETCGRKPSRPCPRSCQPARCQCPAHKGFKRNSAGECVKC